MRGCKRQDLNDPTCQICYCLKKNLDKCFPRRVSDS